MTTVREMDLETRREYERRRKAEERRRKAAAAAEGRLPYDEAMMREVLADAALLAIRAGGGLADVEQMILRAYDHLPGKTMHSAAGMLQDLQMRPKYLGKRRITA
jgi:hypothetical protein